MYIPLSFRVDDRAALFDFVNHHSFATLFSQHDNHPFASHLPLLLDTATGSSGRLLGHMARANPHWETAANQRVLTVFHGPHAYISPSWYAAQNVVPTWNYVAVHATGVLRLIDDRDRLYEILRQTVIKYESPRATPWSIEAPEPEFLEKLLAAIVGFEIEVEMWEGKWKLSQNHPQERRDNVVTGLRSTGRPDELAIAALMSPVDKSD